MLNVKQFKIIMSNFTRSIHTAIELNVSRLKQVIFCQLLHYFLHALKPKIIFYSSKSHLSVNYQRLILILGRKIHYKNAFNINKQQ